MGATAVPEATVKRWKQLLGMTAAALLSGCAASLPPLRALPAWHGPGRVTVLSLSARGNLLPATPLSLQIEQDSAHFSGALIGDWSRLLTQFSLSPEFSGSRASFSGVRLSPRALATVALGMTGPAALTESLLPEDWNLTKDGCLLHRGRPFAIWESHTADSLRDLRAADGSWEIRSVLISSALLTDSVNIPAVSDDTLP